MRGQRRARQRPMETSRGRGGTEPASEEVARLEALAAARSSPAVAWHAAGRVDPAPDVVEARIETYISKQSVMRENERVVVPLEKHIRDEIS